MNETMKIATGKYVEVAYELHVGDEEEGEEYELMEKASTEKPMRFIFGAGLMLASFEAQLKGKKAGDTFKFTLRCEEAYGDYHDDHVTQIPKSSFHINGKFDEEIVKVDKIIPMYDTEGKRLEGVVVEVREDIVVMDFNHPLAGETLHFEGQVLEVREPTVEELADLSPSSSCGCEGGCGGSCH
ncbi:MAG: FKBP-type peptidyl-prolyl cis-trans isomerase [Tannerellaceae bacterium]|nr:FKBP-type peptidyl-prolyl cis-trans isomerase [Tannerellaceae bacterium]